MAIYVVQAGDTLTAIADKYSTTVSTLVKLNDIENPDYIVIGQKIALTSEDATPSTANTTYHVRIKVMGIQSGTERTVYASWKWDRENTDHYEVSWTYDTGDGIWFTGKNESVTVKQSVYDAPTNAKRVRLIVLPVPKTKGSSGSTTEWTAEKSTASIFDFSEAPPQTPSGLSITLENYKLTATLDNLDVNADKIEFQVVKNNSSKVYKTGKANITTGHASYSWTVAAGYEYKVRCRALRDSSKSEWSDYSSNYQTAPAAPSGITTCRAASDSSVYLKWGAVSTATSYTIQYTDKKDYFNGSNSVSEETTDLTQFTLTGLESGTEYFFRVKAINNTGESAWTKIKSVVLGKKPAAPTTWSSSTKVVTGESLILYWVHNSEDGSSQTFAELEIYINGIKEPPYTIENTASEEDKDKTSSYDGIDTSLYDEGTQIQWRVRTAGVTKVYGDWSVQRTIDIYSPPTLDLSVTDIDGNHIDTLVSFPIQIDALAEPATQTPTGYHLSVVSNDIYETVDYTGESKTVNKGEQVYSKYFDTSEPLSVTLLPNDIDLENNASYTIKCTVAMNSGLTAESSSDFTVAWSDFYYTPNAEITVDKEALVTHIRPYCLDENEEPIEGVTLSVYRREFDGSFTKIEPLELNNTDNIFLTDPHPALDYARYRVVAMTTETGAVSYYDLPGIPMEEKAVVIQWDEDWSTFGTFNVDDVPEQPAWSGSMLKLPYNIDISDNHTSDVALIEYIGRKRPVSYYGTQLGETATWNVEIPKGDKDTLYDLRRLAIWLGDVYVREPSGSGYWANVKVSISQTHCDMAIPVNLEITRVEGGM